MTRQSKIALEKGRGYDNFHDYHLVINWRLKFWIMLFALRMNWTFSDAVIFMLASCGFYFKQYFKAIAKFYSKHPVVEADVDCHVYFRIDNYWELKEKHGFYGSYSMAVYVRSIALFFLQGVDRYGLWRFLLIMKNIRKQFEFSNRTKKIRRQFVNLSRHMVERFEIFSYLLTDYLHRLVKYMIN